MLLQSQEGSMTTPTVQPPLSPRPETVTTPASTWRSKVRRSRRTIPVGRIIACILCGVVATIGISIASAVLLPFVRPNPPNTMLRSGSILIPGAYPTIMQATTFRQRMEYWMANHQTVEVATWGDHLQPWHIRVSSPFASRLAWFEKGRVYSRQDVKAPPTASGAAVNCWSFATSCWSATGSKTTGPLPAPPELTDTNAAHSTWATAIEERGWPFRAFTCRLAAPMGDANAPTYTLQDALWAQDADASATTEAIHTLRVVPTRPLWPGLIADASTFGAAFYAASLLPAVTARTLRLRRGRCPACGYSLKGQPEPGCPECGWKRQEPPPAA
jgi:hypothetical protein